MKRQFVKGLIVLVIALAFTGTLAAQGVTLSAVTQFGFASWDKVWSETMRAWEKKTGNTVKEESVDWNNHEMLVKTGIVNGNPYDMAFFWPERMVEFTRDNMAMDLTPYLEANNGAWKNTFSQKLLDLGKVNGHYYSIPIHISGSIMYYNKAILKKYNITPPVTIDEYIAAAKKLKGTGIALMGAKNGVYFHITRSDLSQAAKDAGVFDNWIQGKVSFTSPFVKTFYTKVAQLFQDPEAWYGGVPGCFNLTADELTSAYLKGKVAMFLDNIVLAGFYAADTKDNDLGITYMPTLTKTNISIDGGANGFFIPYNTKHPAEAVSLIKEFGGQDFQMRCWKELGIVGALKTLPVTKEAANVIQYIDPRDVATLSPELGSEIDKSIMNIVLGSNTVDSELAYLEQLRQQAIAK